MADLFRQEVVSRRAASVFGGVVIERSPAQAVAALIAAALAVALVCVAVFGTYVQKTRVPGYVAPSAGLVRVAAPRPATVVQVHVTEGESVAARQLLLTLAAPFEGMSGDADAAALDRLFEERRALEARIALERTLGDAAVRDVQRRIAALDVAAHSVAAQLETARARAALLAQDVARLESLRERGHIAASLFDARLADRLEADQQVLSARREAERMAAEREALESERAQLPLRTEANLADLFTHLSALGAEIAAADARWVQQVRAPVAGRVWALTATPGAGVGPEHALLTLVPQGSRPNAELLVPSAAAGFVHEGQRVRVRYDAYPYQKFGLHGATVRSVSRAVLLPEDQVGPVRLGVPAFRVVAELDDAHVAAHGRDLPLPAGLALQADILRDRRRIVEWLFEPVFAAARSL